MFKKPISVLSQTMLTQKDRAALQQALTESLNKEAVDAFFADNDLIQVEKLKSSKQLIYSTDDYPAFVDATGKGIYFPSIDEVRIKEGIDGAVLKGANLMWDGVADQPSQLGGFKKDDVRAIVTFDGKLIALGAMGSDSNDIKSTDPAVYILLTIQDSFWEYGPKELVPAKAQFARQKAKPQQQQQQQQQQVQQVTKQVEKPTKKVAVVEQQDSSDDDTQNDNLALLMGGLKGKVNQKKATKKAPVQTQAAKPLIDSDDDNKHKNKKKSAKSTTNKPEEEKNNKSAKAAKESDEEESKEGPSIPLKVMDEYIREAFLNAIKVGFSDKNLPIEAQLFYTTYMLVFCRANIQLDLKNSSYQKIGKFLTQMAKEDIIEYKEAKKGQQSQITMIDRSCELYEQWEPTILKANKQEDNSEGGKGQQYKANIELQELYQPAGMLVAIFEVEGEKKEKDEPKYYTKEEVKKIIMSHVQKNCEIDKKKKNVINLKDSPLVQLIGNEVEEEDEQPDQKDNEDSKKKKRVGKTDKDTITQEQLLIIVYEALNKFHKVTAQSNNKSEIKPGEFKGIVVTAEKQHNKNVTTILGLEQFGFDNALKPDNIYSLQYLDKVLSEKLTCQVTIHELPGKNAGREILLNGIFLDQVVDFLTNECKIGAAYIHEVNKITSKKKPQTFK